MENKLEASRLTAIYLKSSSKNFEHFYSYLQNVKLSNVNGMLIKRELHVRIGPLNHVHNSLRYLSVLINFNGGHIDFSFRVTR